MLRRRSLGFASPHGQAGAISSPARTAASTILPSRPDGPALGEVVTGSGTASDVGAFRK